MKAYSLYGVDDLKYEDVGYPECPSGWAIVKVKAAGICSSDIPRIFIKGTYHFPTIPGHEFSGIVDKVADDENNELVGKKVGVFPLIPCRKCTQCQQGQYEMCANYDYVGSRRDGGFAEYVAVPVWNLVELPDNASLTAVAMMEPLAVALHAMRQSKMKTGNSVAIVGTGMIGFAAAQWALKLGAAKVVIVGRGESKRKIADAIRGVSYVLMNEIEEEFDVVLEAVGSNAAIDKAISLVKPAGSLVLMGNPEGDITLTQNTYWRILRKQLHISGTWNSAYECGSSCDWSEVRDVIVNKEIEVESLISHCFKQIELKKGLQVMLNHEEPYCKIMTVWNEEN